RAYDVAANHFLEPGDDFARLEWLAGFLALRKLNKPDLALFHFQRHGSAVTSPISLGRTHYWQGRALEASGKAEAAQAAYTEGAKYQTAFYGLLAAEKAGVALSPSLAGTEQFSGWREAPFARSSVFESGLLLLSADQPRLGVRFLTHLSESLDRTEIGQITGMAEEIGLPYLQLMLAKRGVKYGTVLERPYYPLHPVANQVRDVPAELALAIARRESEFFVDAASGVGALGLMQLMPPTAKEMAGKLGVPFSRDRLTTDPSYNAALGVRYLQELIQEFGNSPIQVAAAYNAGPSRPRAWMQKLGDPRRGQIDVIDWIEQIPFDETRNYVMRVSESLPVYRARLNGQLGPVTFTQELLGKYVPPPAPAAPVVSLRPLVRPAVFSGVPATE
ncbi:MAG: lytic transglycosylase domain-containing protein, partial [Planktomarina sp.]